MINYLFQIFLIIFNDLLLIVIEWLFILIIFNDLLFFFIG